MWPATIVLLLSSVAASLPLCESIDSASHVVVRLVRRYPEMRIICFDKLDYCSSLSNLNAVSENDRYKNYVFIRGDILDAALVSDTLKKYQIDTIMHFAAQTHVGTYAQCPCVWTAH